MNSKIDKAQRKRYGVYYIGAPFGLTAQGELWYSSDQRERCEAYINRRPMLYGNNSIIRERTG
ncbi:hypothetical protein [Sedimentisphaera salicampi]|uniref:hypothetical protein n=1 Tax=Sedimentisphaera salicampi TaxID=1941349 RepID=UPI000B9A7434|nr:hypothetical protein [Sedimentisphaera salicampi]OXU15721.1 hypothetical protein SMSP1_00508 [Sedimentisphaera salicampi]